MNHRLPHPLTLLSAALYVLSFPPHGLAFLGWFALVPWLILVSRLPEGPETRRKTLLQGLWLGVLISLGGFFWVAYVIHEFGGLPWVASIFGLLLFSLIGQPQWLFFAPLARRQLLKSLDQPRGRVLFSMLWLAAAYTALDWLVPKLFRDTFGHHWVAFENLRMNARWSGAYGMTFLAVLANLTIARTVVGLKLRREPSAWPALKQLMPLAVTTATVLLAVWTYGRHSRQEIATAVRQAPESITLSVIQANIGDLEKFAARSGVRQARKKVLDTFVQLSDQALQKQGSRPHALVWPETAYPSSFRKPRTPDELELDQVVENFARTRQIPLLFGGYDETTTSPRRDYNALFFLGREAGAGDLQVYHKTRLLLFGEEMPLSETFPALRRWFPTVGNFARGDGPRPYTLPTQPAVRAVPAICYEVLFSDDMARAKRDGAQLILNVTNDSWFGPYAEPELHLALSTFRSIETGIPMLRATNTGISAWVDPTGSILQQTAIGVPAVLEAKVPLAELPPSLVERWGDFVPKLLFLFAVAPFLFPAWRRRW